MKNKIILAIILSIIILILSGCVTPTAPNIPDQGDGINHNPIISDLSASPRTAYTNQNITITCNASDQDGDTLAYSWSSSPGGTITGSGSTITWISPATKGTYTITCLVSDGKGGEDSKSVGITVASDSGGVRYSISWSEAESNGWKNPLGEGKELITSTAYDYDSGIYLYNHPEKKHMGIDIVSEENDKVYSITDGTIRKMVRGSDTKKMVVIIEHTNSNNEDFFAIYGHVLAGGDLELNSELKAGEKIGVVKKSGSPCHLHFGVNLSSEFIDDLLAGNCGWGLIPESANPSDYSWVEPINYLNTQSATFISDVASGLIHNINKDTYYNTIRAALDDADNDNTIEVSDGIYDESITFPFSKKIILRSINGASSTTIRGDNDLPTVTLNGSLAGITLEGFTITHASGNYGRGIYTNGNLTIKNCTIIFNNSLDKGGGGGIYNYYGTLTITGSTISNNFANTYDGGGISNDSSTLTITGSNISGNIADFGGGIDNYSSTLTIIGSTISGNTADWGGGIHNLYGTYTIIGSTISGNTAAHDGGGIENYKSLLTITGSTISNNSANNGGGIYKYSPFYELTITGSTISNNSANNGGGIYFDFWGWGSFSIGGYSDTKKNIICGNYKKGYNPSLDQQIRDDYDNLYETYKDTNYISAYCD